jgi:hypothetical protein
MCMPRVNIRNGADMTEQVPEDLTEAEVVDRLEVGRSESEGDVASEVDRWDDEGGTTAPAEPSGLYRHADNPDPSGRDRPDRTGPR